MAIIKNEGANVNPYTGQVLDFSAEQWVANRTAEQRFARNLPIAQKPLVSKDYQPVLPLSQLKLSR